MKSIRMLILMGCSLWSVSAYAVLDCHAENISNEMLAATRSLLHSHNYQAAKQLFDQCLQLQPNDAKCLFGRAISYHSLGNDAAALSDCDAALRVDARNSTLHILRYDILLHLNKFNEAIDFCDQLLASGERDCRTYTMRAQADQFVGRYDHVVADSTKAIEANPTFWYAYSLRAHALGLLGYLDAACADLARCLKLQPTHTRTDPQPPSLEEAAAATHEAKRVDFSKIPPMDFTNEF